METHAQLVDQEVLFSLLRLSQLHSHIFVSLHSLCSNLIHRVIILLFSLLLAPWFLFLLLDTGLLIDCFFLLLMQALHDFRIVLQMLGESVLRDRALDEVVKVFHDVGLFDQFVRLVYLP